MVETLRKTVWQFLVLFGIYPNELKSYSHTETCPRMCITALFIIACTQKQPRCPSVGEWINKLVHPDNGILFSTEKKSTIKSLKTRKKLQCILLSERSQSEKATYYKIATV